MISSKGDDERQAFLRDKAVKEAKDETDIYVRKILPVLMPEARLVDIGCGTAHIIKKLATNYRNALFIGLDISRAMINLAKSNTVEQKSIKLVQGDGLQLPFCSSTVDVVINRLANYKISEAYRILKRGGYFFEYGLGPDADREIAEFFPDRYLEENFFIPKDPANWQGGVIEKIKRFGFSNIEIEDYKDKEYYENKEEIMDLIEMIPLLRTFDREKDEERIKEFIDKYGDDKGIGITWHYYILKAKKF